MYNYRVTIHGIKDEVLDEFILTEVAWVAAYYTALTYYGGYNVYISVNEIKSK